MIEERQMGSQTLEILRQGVWASLTGGWFYDPHQDVFSNTFHLYIWLFLLCTPFTIYVYFPPTRYIWSFYCLLIAIVLTVIKLINYILHHMYDTSECIREEIEENWQETKREDEGIELQDLSNKNLENVSVPGTSSYLNNDNGILPSTDADSFESTEFQQNDNNCKNNTNQPPISTIDLKAEVHRKNSSESSDDTQTTPSQDLLKKTNDQRIKHQRSKTDGAVFLKSTKNVEINNIEDNNNNNNNNNDNNSNNNNNSSSRRHSSTNNFQNNLHFLQPTGSLELSYIDKNLNQPLISDNYYFNNNNCTKKKNNNNSIINNNNNSGTVRRIRSTVLETCYQSSPTSSTLLTTTTLHPNSLEVLGCKNTMKNPLPPPSTNLIRNQHNLNLCSSYYDSEIVYPIAEQSDEHQTISHHSQDTDLDSTPIHISDSDLDEQQQQQQKQNSSLFYITVKTITNNVPYQNNNKNDEEISASSKDALIDQSTTTTTPEMQDARTDLYISDNDINDNDIDGKLNNNNNNNNNGDDDDDDDDITVDKNDDKITTNKKNKTRKRIIVSTSKNIDEIDNFSSLIDLDLDWLFDDNNNNNNNDHHHHQNHRKELMKRDNEWSSTTSSISLEHDVSKVLQEPTPSSISTTSTRSLGAIPKKKCTTRSDIIRKLPKSESEKCSNCRCNNNNNNNNKIDDKNFNRIKPIKEHKNTQTLRLNNNTNNDNGEGLECVILPTTQRVQQQHQQRFRYTSLQRNEEFSSNGSNNELSTLLPPPSVPLLSAFLLQRDNIRFNHNTTISGGGSTTTITTTSPRNRLKRTRVNRRRSNQKIRRDTAIASSLSAGYGTHCAKNFNDTSDGSVHCFMDEQGNWITYTFDEKGYGIANVQLNQQQQQQNDNKLRRRQLQQQQPTTSRFNQSFEYWDNSNSNSSVSIILDTPQTMIPTRNMNLPKLTTNLQRLPTSNDNNNNNNNRNVNHLEINLPIDDSVISIVRDNNNINESSTTTTTSSSIIKNHFKFIQNDSILNNNNNNNNNNGNQRRMKTFYKLKILPKFFIKITLDRLKLLTLLDRNLTIFETLLSIFLGILVSILGAILLYLNFYQDFLAFLFCFIIASCQYSLLKSVQPDAASPTHGFNRIIAYSRPIYFCIFATIIIILTLINNNNSGGNLEILLLLRDFLINFLLFFPLIFSFGLFPQINTFVLYLLEQIDIYLFGGNAMLNLLSSFYCILRSILIILIMQGFLYGSLYEEEKTKQSRHILFSIFCSCLITSSYHLSRCTSDPIYLWNIIKQNLLSLDIYREHNQNQQEHIRNDNTNNNSNNNNVNNEKNQEENPLNQATRKEEKSVKFNNDINNSDVIDNSDDNNNKNSDNDNNNNNNNIDPLPLKLQQTVKARLKNDIIICCLISILVFSIHASTIFTALQPELTSILTIIITILGFLLHYIIPQLRKQLPWMCIARPLLRANELNQYQIREPAKIMWYEKVYVYLSFIERNILYPLLFLSILTEDSPKIATRYGPLLASFIISICGLKLVRNSYSNQSSQYLILIFTTLFFRYDYKLIEEPFLIQYFFISIFYHKIYELLLKLQFVVTYIAPWQITWGSAFHAFAQPFSVPHSAMLFLQIIISSILSTPLNPFLGSAIFLTSYVRPIKFWERDYNTRRVDHSNTQLLSHLERNLGCDDNNLNSIFYEHLTRSLQHSLCGDLIMGRWGIVQQGDCFVLASDYLNCLIHIIEMGNGLVTFQMRGLEFRGTYCQQREVEAITEGVEENDACCCIETDHFNGVLSASAAFSQRWLAWEVTASKYILEGYSISDNSAASMLQVFEFRKVLISYYVKSIIFYTVRSPKLDEWLNSPAILKALQPIEQKNFVDLDPIFNANIDEDYDINNSGMTRQQFYQIHGDWIGYCVEKIDKNIDTSCNSILVLLCFALSLLGRRALGAVSHNTVSSVEFFLYGLHALFKGDFRITCARDEWVFIDIDLLKTIVAPGVRMSLKLHQDHFMSPDEYEELSALYDAICKHEDELVISHEGDPAWRNAILNGTPSLLALRHVLDDGTDEYKIIMLNKRYLSFRVIKINKECVRGLWAGQQQELVYLRNRNPERGSIQNAKQALRNIINSSCDQPIGYPIYVSPLTTSYAETNEQLCSLIGGSISLTKCRNFILNLFRRIRKRCGEGCSSGSGSATVREEIGMGHDGIYAMTTIQTTTTTTNQTTTTITSSQSIDGSHLSGSIGRGSSLSRTSLGGNRGSLVSVGKPTSATLASLATLFKERDERVVSQTPDGGGGGGNGGGGGDVEVDKEYSLQRVRIIDPNLVYDGINLGRRIDVCWPTEYMRLRGGRSFWKDWVPEAGMEGPVIHRWIPCHKDPARRSHVDRTILLIQIDDKFVPIAECGVQDLGQEV